METNNTMRIAPFDGSEDGWKMWSGKFIAWSSMRDYEEILEGDTVVPDVNLGTTRTRTN